MHQVSSTELVLVKESFASMCPFLGREGVDIILQLGTTRTRVSDPPCVVPLK